MLQIIPSKWNQKLVSVFSVFCYVLHISPNFFTLNNNKQSMRLQCLGLTWKFYILWSPQLDNTQAGRWMYINIYNDK